MLTQTGKAQDQAEDMGRYAAIKLLHDLVKEKMVTFELIAYESFKETWQEEIIKKYEI